MALQLPSGPLPFNVQTPDVLGGQARAATLSGLLSENALRQQLAPLQVQEQQEKAKQAQIQTQLQQIALQDSQALSKMFTEGDVNEDVPAAKSPMYDQISAYSGMDPSDPAMGLIRNMAKHGMSGAGLLAQATGIIQRRKENAQATEEQRKIIKDNYETWKDGTAQLYNADPKDQSIMLAQMLPRFANATHLSPELDTALQHLRQRGVDAIPEVYNLVAAQDKALGLSKTAAEAVTAAQKVIPTGGTMSPETAQQVAKDVAVATNPLIQKGKEEVARVEGEAHARIQAELARGGDAAVANVPPHLVAQASTAAEKAGTKYAGLSSQIGNIKSQLAAAKSGDEVASAFAPVAAALGSNAFFGTHRLAPAEVQALGSHLGSIGREINTWFDKHATGTLPPDSLKEFNGLVDRLAKAALTEYKNSLTVTNQTYGSTFKPVALEGGEAPPTAPAAKTYTQADVDAAVAANPGMTAKQIEAAFKAKKYTKQ